MNQDDTELLYRLDIDTEDYKEIIFYGPEYLMSLTYTGKNQSILDTNHPDITTIALF